MMQMSAPKKLLVGLAALATIFSVAGCEGDQAAPADSAPIQNAPVATPQSAPVVVEVEDEPELEEPTVLEADPASDSIDVSDFVAVRALLDELDVKGRAPKTGYDRDLFGQKWSDVDHNGCDTRNDVLNRDLTDVTYKEGTKDCVVLTGTLDDPYTASIISFQRGQDTSIAVQVDHVVALSDAWQKGAQALTPELRTEFANDPLNLLAVDGPANAQKGDGDAATWLPANKGFRCEYVSRQVLVKAKYSLWVTQAEHDAIAGLLDGCIEKKETAAAEADAAEAAAAEQAAADKAAAEAAAAEKAAAEAAAQVPTDVYYKNCSAARAAGAAPVLAGQPGYGKHLDRDGDGIGCE